jgi:NAD(P)H-dependent FMN reductase
MITIRFSADEVAAVGLPHRGAYVQFDDLKRLDGYSNWLTKSSTEQHEAALDRLIAAADAIVYH